MTVLAFCLFSLFHHHIEEESATCAEAFRLDPNLTLAALHDLLDYEEAKANTLTVKISSAVKLTKLLKQVGYILCGDAYSGIFNRHLKSAIPLSVAYLDLDTSLLCELKRIFYKIYHDLQ